MLNETINCVVTDEEMHNYIHTAGYIAFGLVFTCTCCLLKLVCKC